MGKEAVMDREKISPGVEKTLVIRDELGLHARPAAKLAQAAQQFQATITLEHGDMVVDAKSILDILSLAAEHGTSLVLRCTGDDACSAAEKLEELFL
jgi:phosphocarrier protein